MILEELLGEEGREDQAEVLFQELGGRRDVGSAPVDTALLLRWRTVLIEERVLSATLLLARSDIGASGALFTPPTPITRPPVDLSLFLLLLLLVGSDCGRNIGLEVLLELFGEDFGEVNNFLERPKKSRVINKDVVDALEHVLAANDKVHEQARLLLGGAPCHEECQNF